MTRRDYGTGSIRPKGPGSWELRWYDPPDPISGKRARRSKIINGTKREAASRLATLSAGNRPIDTTAVTLGQTIDHWRTDTRHATGTARNYDLARATLPERTLDLPLAQIDVHNMRAIVDHVERAHGPHRGRLVHALISGALRHAWELHWITENIAPRVPRPKPERGRHIEPTPEQIRALLEHVAANPQWFAWLAVTVDTGARRSEVLALRWRNVNLDDGSIFIEHAVDPVAKDQALKATKTENVRTVSIGTRTRSALAAWRAAMVERAESVRTTLHPDAFVFSGAYDGSKVWRPDLATKRFIRLRNKIGMTGVRLSDCRHFVATQLLGAGYDTKNVAARLGHTRVQTTQDAYANRLPGRDREMADHLETL